MVARLGDVLYWAGCGLGVLGLLGAGAAYYNVAQDQERNFWMIAGLAFAAVSWLFGRAARCVLAGR